MSVCVSVCLCAWQATTNCQDAKDYLEMMCQDLTSELAQFDLLKEQELKQILLAYVTAQLEAQEKVRKHYVCRPKSLQCRHMFMYTVAHIHKNPYYIPPPSLPPSLLLSFLSPPSLPLSHFSPPVKEQMVLPDSHSRHSHQARGQSNTVQDS